MLTSVTDWATETITFDRRGVEILAVVGDYRTCDPGTLRRSIAAYVGVTPEDVFADLNLLVVVAPVGTFLAPATYRAWVDEAVSEAERETRAQVKLRRRAARIAAENIALLAEDTGLPLDAIMRAAIVAPETAEEIMGGERLPHAALVRIATALGVTVESLRRPGAR